MSLSVSSCQDALTQALARQAAAKQVKEAAETAKAVAEEQSAIAEGLKTEAKDLQTEADKLSAEKKAKLEGVQQRLTDANGRVTSIRTEYEGKVLLLSQVKQDGDEAQIAVLEEEVTRLFSDLQAAVAEANQIQAEADQIQAEADEAAAKAAEAAAKAEEAENNAKIAQETLAKSVKDLEDAEKELEEADAEVAQAQADLEAAEAEEAAKIELTADVNQLTEAEAVAQGYTVIKTPEDLMAIANDLHGNYILMNDIDLSGYEWVPIGNETNPFEGKLNGNGFNILNLHIKQDNGTDTQDVGFFGVTKGAEIRDVAFVNATIETPEGYNAGGVGIVAGRAINTVFDNVAASGSVTGHQKVGGLVGCVEDTDTPDTTGNPRSYFNNCNTNVNINASYYAGGMIGYVASTYTNDLMISNCSTNGNIVCLGNTAGGLIGEAGKTIITITDCTSGVNITCTDEDTTFPLLKDRAKCGGIIGNANGTFIAICNSEYTGWINAYGEFKGENYGYYMNDAHVSIFELPGGLPVDDILKLDGVEGLQSITDEASGKVRYNITVSTITGLDKIVAMIRNNPELADYITFNVNFDFEAIDGAYDPTTYAQYGIVEHIYEDENGEVVRDVYIDNEIDSETTYHFRNNDIQDLQEGSGNCNSGFGQGMELRETFVKGLYTDDNGNYYVKLGPCEFVPVTLNFDIDGENLTVKKRLSSEEVEFRKTVANTVLAYQREMYKIILNRLGFPLNTKIPKIGEPEYRYLKYKQMNGETLTSIEQLKLQIFELDYRLIDISDRYTSNFGCGMGGKASFLNTEDAQIALDADGRIRYTTLTGIELRQRVDEEGNLMFDEYGAPLYETLDGEPYVDIVEVFPITEAPVKDDNGNLLYTDEEGNTVVAHQDEEGNVTYAYTDGTAFEGDPATLKQQVVELNPSDTITDLKAELDALYDEIANGGTGGFPETNATGGDEGTGETGGTGEGEEDPEKDKDKEEDK